MRWEATKIDKMKVVVFSLQFCKLKRKILSLAQLLHKCKNSSSSWCYCIHICWFFLSLRVFCCFFFLWIFILVCFFLCDTLHYDDNCWENQYALYFLESIRIIFRPSIFEINNWCLFLPTYHALTFYVIDSAFDLCHENWKSFAFWFDWLSICNR